MSKAKELEKLIKRLTVKKKVAETYKKTKEITIHWVLTKEDIKPFKDSDLEDAFFNLEVYGCIETIAWKNIFISLPNILKDFKNIGEIIGKINYTVVHELVHSALENTDEDLVHSICYKVFRTKKYTPIENRSSIVKIPVIELE